MDYKKKHKEEIVRATQLWECGDITRENLEYIFPELRESEDEKISREITEFIVNFHNGNYEKPYDYTIGTWLAWLDKKAGKDKLNVKKKELRKIEQKPKWSYEDEANLNNIIWLCNNCLNGEETTWIPSQAEKIKHLIETIKERGLTQQKPKWSEEDEKRIERICNFVWKNRKGDTDEIYQQEQDVDWLRTLKDRVEE